MSRQRLASLALLPMLALAGCAVEGAQAPRGVAGDRAPGSAAAPVASSQAPAPQRPTPSPSATTAPSATSAPAPASTPTTGPTPASERTTAVRPTPTPTVKLVLEQGTVAPLVREMQARLRQLGMFPGYDVTDTFGPVTAQGVLAFKQSLGQATPADANLDEKTWAALRAQTAPPSTEELANKVPGPVVVAAGNAMVPELQHRLTQLGLYGGALDGGLAGATVEGVRKFQSQQGIAVTGELDQRTLDRLVGLTRQPTPNELKGNPEPMGGGFTQVLDPRCLKGRVICGSMEQRRVSWVIDGKVLLTMEARFGSKEHPSRPGVFEVWLKDANAKSYLFGPVVDMPYSMFYDEDRGVHFSEDFTWTGWDATSHGCLNVRDYEGVKWLYSQVVLGDKVVIY